MFSGPTLRPRLSVTGLSCAVTVAGALALLVPQPATASCVSATLACYGANATDNNSQSSGIAGMFDIGSNFLMRLNHEATWGTGAANNNPNGGGAPAPAATPRYRTWAEGYVLGSRTAERDTFAGDFRRTTGGVAGLAHTVSPGVTIGISVDHSHTGIDLPTVFQTATLDLTQIGGYLALERGPWTLTVAATHGEGRLHSRRDTGLGIATADYSGRIDGVLTEASYYFGFDQARIVPKVAIEYLRSSTSGLTETGGFNPVTVGDGFTERARLLAGVEVGRYFIVHQHVIDLSGYAKFVDNFYQRIGNVQVTPQFGLPVAVSGVLEGTYGADLGAAASFNMTTTARVYAAYDGKFRSGFESHTGTVGIDIRW